MELKQIKRFKGFIYTFCLGTTLLLSKWDILPRGAVLILIIILTPFAIADDLDRLQ